MQNTGIFRARGLAIVALGLAAAVLAYVLVGREDERSSAAGTQPADVTPPASPPPPAEVRPTLDARTVSIGELKAEAQAQSRPLYWAGPRAKTSYELSRTADGRSYIRYLTGKATAGDPSASFLTVATYPLAGGFEAVSAEAAKPGNTRIDLDAGGIAVMAPSRPLSVYLSYPGADYQVEVYSPDPAVAERLVRTGKIRPVGGGTPVASGQARAFRLAGLRALAAGDGPIYWAGPRAMTTYEVTRIAGGRTFVRYLPRGAEPGDPDPKYLTVATYPEPDAMASIKAASSREGAATLELPGGGLAVYDAARPTSVFVAFPDTPFQIEVYSPKPAEARALVRRGRIVPIR
ncbi:MAG: hypothetical protein ACKVUT_04405 [Gaiella sp.]